MTQDLEARERIRLRLIDAAKQQFPASVRMTHLELGPPVGFPVQFHVIGPDAQVVRRIAPKSGRSDGFDPKARNVRLD